MKKIVLTVNGPLRQLKGRARLNRAKKFILKKVHKNLPKDVYNYIAKSNVCVNTPSPPFTPFSLHPACPSHTADRVTTNYHVDVNETL